MLVRITKEKNATLTVQVI